jgi:hypothetical protein
VLALAVLLAPDPAVAEGRDGVDASIQRNALPSVGLDNSTLAGFLADLDIAQREVVLVEQISDLGGGSERLLFGAAILYRFSPQCLDARLETVEVGGLPCGGRHIRIPGVVQGRTGTRGHRPGKERHAETHGAHIHNQPARSAMFPDLPTGSVMRCSDMQEPWGNNFR